MPYLNKRGAFTLVELLVVIGVIVVLIAMLLPSLGRAREGAQRVACGSNLRQIGVGTQVYANEDRGRIAWGVRRSSTMRGLQRPFDSYVAYTRTWPSGTVRNGQMIPFSLGALHAGRFVPDARVFYCTSITVNPDSSRAFEYYPRPWGSGWPAGDWCVRTGYLYYPYGGMNDTYSGITVINEREDKINSTSAQQMLSADDFLQDGVTPHGKYWAVGRLDGSVNFVANDVLGGLDLTSAHVQAGWDWVTFSEIRRRLLEQ